MADGIKGRVAGVWKDFTPHIKVASVWKTPDKVHIKVAGVWKEVWVDIVTPTCSLSTANVSHSNDFTCYAQVQYNVNGIEYNNSGGTQNYSVSRGNWVDSGDAEGAWVSYLKNSGSTPFDTNIPTTAVGRSQMNINRNIRIRDTVNGGGAVTGNYTIYMHSAATGGTLLSSATYSLTATYFNACPTCCFTPDTVVTLGSGVEVKIRDVREGDTLMTKNGPEEVGKIIVVTDVPISVLTFEDGRKLELTADHPVHTERGPASLTQYDEYKDIGPTVKLEVGDRVFTDEGEWLRLVGIRHERVQPIVYTFSNSLFYANGLLVY